MSLSAAIAVDGVVDDSLASATLIEVHERMGESASFRLRYDIEVGTGDFGRLVDKRLDPGTTLSLLVDGDDGRQCLVKGPVRAQKIHFECGSGGYVEVHGSDTSVVMDREARSAVWSDTTDGDTVAAIVARYGLVPDIATTAAGHLEAKHVLIQRETDLSFVRRLARRNGCWFWISCDAHGVETAHFRPPPVDGPVAATLSLGPNSLTALDLRWDAERSTSTVGTQLDLNTGKDLDGSKSGTPVTALGARDLAAITGVTHSIFVVAPADDAGALQARSAGALTESTFFIRASGTTTRTVTGDPIRALTVVELIGLGSRHSGKYLVSGVRHTIDPTNHTMELTLLRNAWGA